VWLVVLSDLLENGFVESAPAVWLVLLSDLLENPDLAFERLISRLPSSRLNRVTR
jgi:hypothetical protein